MKFKLKCCEKENPIGVNREGIRLSFEVDGSREVTSFEIQIATSLYALKTKDYNVGCFRGNASEGYFLWLKKDILEERTAYYWQVEAVTADGRILSEPAFFETGIENWKADWICGYAKNGEVQNFRKTFELKGNIQRAVLYVCGLGYFDAQVNGEKVDDTFYKPLVTDYAPRKQQDDVFLYANESWRTVYYTYDVTKLLKEGENILSFDVADGYFCNRDKLYGEADFSYGDNRLIYELYIMQDGQETLVKSDGGTKVRTTEFCSTLYKGDHLDAEQKPQEYKKSVVCETEMGKAVSSQCPGDKIAEILDVKWQQEVDGGMLYDFGKNHSGGLAFSVDALEKSTVLIRYAEVLDENGRPNYETSAWHGDDYITGKKIDVYQENEYTFLPGKQEVRPAFSWYCYRYVWIQIVGNAKISDLHSWFIHTDVKRDGHMSCSDESLNRLNEMFIQTLFCNMHSGLITDCPHREKRPYTGDTNIIMKAAWYNLDIAGFFYKWLEDILDAQTTDGLIPNTAPNLGGGGGYAWGNAICTVSTEMYRFTGDKEIVKKCYEAVKRWLHYYELQRDEHYSIRKNSHNWMLGDWLAPDIVASNVYYINTVCYYKAADAAAFLAKVLGEDCDQWETLKTEIRKGINQVFFNRDTLSYGNGVQGEDVFALAEGLVPKEYEEALRKKVRNHYSEETGYHLDTGIVLTPILIQYLTDHGYADLAYRIMTADTYPSYYTLMEEDTTFSEHWSKKWPDYYIGDSKSRLVKGGGDLSHCHPMYGGVVFWLFERVAGLDLSRLYEQKILIRPYFTEYLDWAKADKKLPFGYASVKWERTGKGLFLEMEIPQSLVGECCIPSSYKKFRCMENEEVYEVGEDGCFRFLVSSGKWSFQTEEEGFHGDKKSKSEK